MFKIPKQEYTAEFKEGVVKRVIDGGQSVPAVAKDLGLIEQTLRNWVKAAKAGKLHAAGGKTVTPEQMELSRVRAENARLRMENEILKKATAYFAKDAL
jgi:transposase